MRNKTIGGVGSLEFNVIREKKGGGEVHRKVVLAGKKQGNKITTF